MNHNLNTSREHPQNIIVVGVGGTGGFLAEALCRLVTGRRENILLIDHDIVEPHNLLRQNFSRPDIGRHKSQVLAERLAGTFGRPIGYINEPFTYEMFRNQPMNLDNQNEFMYRSARPDIIIGCVDNAKAREELAKVINDKSTPNTPWIVDTGNGRNWGQILIGNSKYDEESHYSFDETTCYRLPIPTIQRPDLLTYVPEEPPDIDCAAAMDLTDQDPTINQMMASLTVQMIRRMLAGTCPFMSLYADLDHGTVTPTYATPENVSRVTGIDTELLIHAEEEQPQYCEACEQYH